MSNAKENLQVLIAAEFPALMDIIAEHKNGVDVSDALDNWRGGGTTGEAIREYLNTLDAKPKRKRSTKTKKDAPTA